MRFKTLAIVAIAAIVLSAPVFAELQNVEVGGSIRIRGNYFSDGLGTFDEDTGPAAEFTEQRTTVDVTADFTDDVTVFIELDSYDIWGTDTRELASGSFGGAPVTGSVDVYQAYIEMREAWGQPLTVRIGRQEILLGSEFLVGNNSTAAVFTHLSYDGVTARYNFDSGDILAIAVKITEGEVVFPFDVDGDADLYGLYGTYTGIEDHTLEAYWLYIRDANGFGVGGITGSDEVGDLHTIGGRASGNFSAFDYEVEAAFQFGEAGDAVSMGGDFEGFAINTELGYTFDNEYNLRLWAGVAFFEGETGSGGDLGFNRLMSDWEYSEFLGNTDLSNIIIVRGGISAQATENIGVSGVISWFEEDDEATGTDESIGWELGLYATYDYSEDLSFNAGYAHFFTDSDVGDGTMINVSGTAMAGNVTGSDDDLDYFFLETTISF